MIRALSPGRQQQQQTGLLLGSILFIISSSVGYIQHSRSRKQSQQQ